MTLLATVLVLLVVIGGITACVLLADRDHRQRVQRQAEYHQSPYTRHHHPDTPGADIPEIAEWLTAGDDYEQARKDMS